MMGRTMLALLLLAAPATDGPQLRYFRYERTIVRAQPDSTGQTCVPLDGQVASHAARGFSDLRIYRGTTETPYALRAHIDETAGQFPAPRIENLGQRDGKVVFDVRMSHPSYRTLEIQTPAHDFVALVTVTGSQSATGPSTRVGDFTIFDLTAQQQPRSTILQMPVSTYPFLHVTVSGPLIPGDIRGLSVVDVSARPLVFHALADSVRITQEGKRTLARVRLPAHVPVERVEVVVPATARDFSRDVVVMRAVSDGKPVEYASGTLFRIHAVRDGRRIDQERSWVDIASAPSSDTGHVEWTLAIENGDDAPLTIDAVRFSMRERMVCFDARAGEGYTLHYGDSALAAPRYDYARLVRASERPFAASLGAEQLNPAFEPRPDTRPWTERHRGLLWVVLAGVVIVLGAIALRSVKSMDA